MKTLVLMTLLFSASAFAQTITLKKDLVLTGNQTRILDFEIPSTRNAIVRCSFEDTNYVSGKKFVKGRMFQFLGTTGLRNLPAPTPQESFDELNSEGANLPRSFRNSTSLEQLAAAVARRHNTTVTVNDMFFWKVEKSFPIQQVNGEMNAFVCKSNLLVADEIIKQQLLSELSSLN